ELLGFSTAAATLAACEAPVIKSIPYVVKPDSITPGVPTRCASTILDGYDYANVFMTTREGRPIRITPNKSAESFTTSNARVQAYALSLYDSYKVRGPIVKSGNTFKPVSWKNLDEKILAKLKAVGGKKIVVLTSSLPSP